MITYFSAGKFRFYPFMELRPRIAKISLWLNVEISPHSLPLPKSGGREGRVGRVSIYKYIYDISFCGPDVAFHAVVAKC